MQMLSLLGAALDTRSYSGEWIRLGRLRAERVEGGCVLTVPQKLYRLSETGKFRVMPSALWLLWKQGRPVKLCCLQMSTVTDLRREISFDVVRNESGEYLKFNEF